VVGVGKKEDSCESGRGEGEESVGRVGKKEESCGSGRGEGEESVGRVGKKEKSCGSGRGVGEESVGIVGKKEESCGNGGGRERSQWDELERKRSHVEIEGGGRGVTGKSWKEKGVMWRSERERDLVGGGGAGRSQKKGVER
jgi:hypothetical protein